MSNPFNLGSPDDYRGPDLGVLRRDAELSLYLPTAEIVAEVLSPHDETWQKLPHYAAHGVGEVWVLDPERHTVQMFVLGDGRYETVAASARMALTARFVEETITWP